MFGMATPAILLLALLAAVIIAAASFGLIAAVRMA